jgi:hypothetical protein
MTGAATFARRRGAIGVVLAIAFCGLAATALLAADQPAAPATAAKPKVDPAKPKNLEPLAAGDATGILGKKVKGPNGEDFGRVVDVVVDTHGRPRAAVIDFGGFLGVGSRKIAIDWQALDFSPSDHDVELSLSRDDIQSAPEYKPDAPTAVMVGSQPTAPSLPDVSK